MFLLYLSVSVWPSRAALVILGGNYLVHYVQLAPVQNVFDEMADQGPVLFCGHAYPPRRRCHGLLTCWHLYGISASSRGTPVAYFREHSAPGSSRENTTLEAKFRDCHMPEARFPRNMCNGSLYRRKLFVIAVPPN